MSLIRRAGAQILRVLESALDPAAAAEEVKVYGKDAAGITQLFARSSDGTVHQITPSSSGGGGADGIYGNGDDGSVVDAVNRTLDRVYLYDNWTINAGVVITPARWPVFVMGTLTIDGSIIEDGGAGTGQVTGGAGGGAAGTGILGFGSSGGNGGGGGAGGSNGAATNTQPRSIGTKGQGGAGGLSGAGGAAGAGGVLTLGVASLGGPYIAGPDWGFFSNSVGVNPIAGGSGGGGGGGGAATGGKGGGGGGLIAIVAKNIVVNGAGLVAARGGAGFTGVAGNGGGGGGGGGGKVLLITRSYTGSAPNVSGGAGGAGQGTGNPGVAGLAGQIVQLLM